MVRLLELTLCFESTLNQSSTNAQCFKKWVSVSRESRKDGGLARLDLSLSTSSIQLQLCIKQAVLRQRMRGGGATRENIPDSVTSQITSPCERHEAICGRLSVRRRARTCWRTPRPVVSVWDDLGSKWVANENEANLLKFHVSSFVVSDSNRGDGQMGYVHLHIALIFSLYVDFSVFVCVCAKECD